MCTHHKDEEDEKDEGGKVDWSQDRVSLLYLRELKVSQDDAELGKTTRTNKTNIKNLYSLLARGYILQWTKFCGCLCPLIQ